jgi:hypothetical protein
MLHSYCIARDVVTATGLTIKHLVPPTTAFTVPGLTESPGDALSMQMVLKDFLTLQQEGQFTQLFGQRSGILQPKA